MGTGTDIPPWLVCDAFNGSMLLLVDMAGSRLPHANTGQRALFMIPLLLAMLYTATRKKDKVSPKINSWSKDVIGGMLTPPICIFLSTLYSILENSMVISGVVTLIEGEQRSWGVMTCIPLLVLCLADSAPKNKLANGLACIAMFACTPLMLIGGPQRLPAPPSRHVLDGVFGTLVAPGLVLLGTPAFGGGSRYWFRWSHTTGVLAGVWYLLIFLVVTSPPSAASWPGVVCVFSCMLLTCSFRGWGTDLRIAWSMASVILGLCVSGDSPASWWCRFSIAVCIGVFRACVLWMGDPYLTGLNSERQVNAEMKRRREEDDGCMFRVNSLDPLIGQSPLDPLLGLGPEMTH